MPLLVFTVIAIGLFGISTAPTVEDVFAEKKEVKMSNTEGSTATISVKDSTEKCSNWVQNVDR